MDSTELVKMAGEGDGRGVMLAGARAVVGTGRVVRVVVVSYDESGKMLGHETVTRPSVSVETAGARSPQ